MKRFLKSVVLVCTIVGTGSTAHAQAPQCSVMDAKGASLVKLSNGQVLKFVSENNALMRNLNAQSAPHLLNKVASVNLQPRCGLTLFGNGGAKWGHMTVKTSGPTGVPAAHIYGIRCECS